MKVKHLIRELQKLDPESEVFTEGCDCHGDAYAVSVGNDGSVLIQRSGNAENYNNGEDTPEPYERETS